MNERQTIMASAIMMGAAQGLARGMDGQPADAIAACLVAARELLRLEGLETTATYSSVQKAFQTMFEEGLVR